MGKTKVVIAQLGSPKSTSTKDVREYLKEFLGDPRVVDLPRFFWWLILNLFVLPFRPKKSAEAYSRIYDGESFPLITITNSFVEKLSSKLDENIEVESAFLLSSPRVNDALDCWEKEDFDTRAKELVVLPQFPQFSESTTASVFDVVGKAFSTRVNFPDIRFITNYHRLKAFIDLSAKQIESIILNQDFDSLVISFHGIPLRRVNDKKDEYYFHCFETFELIKEKLPKEFQDKMHMNFQSRFGSEKWLGPATDEYCVDLVEKGNKKIAVYCPSFVVDCLETTDEIGQELREDIEEAGGELIFIPCLNDSEEWVTSYGEYINILVNGSKKDLDNLFYKTDAKDLRERLPKQEDEEALSKDAKKSLKIMFLTLFLDLVGFSIIFPLFPAMAKYYLENDKDSFILNSIMGVIESFTHFGGGNISSIVLFGGILGALYSLLQFIFSPIWGKLSDKYGRKPILQVSVFGIFISYVLWFFSGSFTLLVVARFIGGMMGGNISVATAVASDVTTEKNRSKAMAFVGIAFACGFLVGPAIGGLLSLIDLTLYLPSLEALGVNPFSMPALFAAILAFINLFVINKKFKETNIEKNSKAHALRTFNPVALLLPRKKKEINLINYTYFLFITLFSGMEFTLTFLALERLGYSSMDNAYMFIFIGVILALVQGGYVRRKAYQVGEQKMALQGLVLIIPGLLLTSFASSNFVLFAGLFFLAMGSSMVIPTLTSLVSLYSDKGAQGEVIGIFRSLGALGRVLGPIIASLLYWKYGSGTTYLLGGVLVLFPIFVLTRFKQVKS